MPTYEYVCTECGAPLEVVQSINDPALTECPACSGRLRKVFGNVGVVFKGSGFYRTDSRGKSSGAEPAAKKPEGAAAPGTSKQDSATPTTAGSASGSGSGSSGTTSPTSAAPARAAS
jgi:putative FmdB family regulatory protein